MRHENKNGYFDNLCEITKKFKKSEGKKPYKRLRKQQLNMEYWEEVYEMFSL